MGWREQAKADVALKVTKASHLINGCEADLGRKLSDGERRDLLKDNTPWDSDLVAALVVAVGEAG